MEVVRSVHGVRGRGVRGSGHQCNGASKVSLPIKVEICRHSSPALHTGACAEYNHLGPANVSLTSETTRSKYLL